MLLFAEAVTTQQMEISLDGTSPKFLPLQRAHAVSAGSASDCCVPRFGKRLGWGLQLYMLGFGARSL